MAVKFFFVRDSADHGVSGLLQCIFFHSTALLGASGIVFMLIMLFIGWHEGRRILTPHSSWWFYILVIVHSALFVQDHVVILCIWW